MTIVLCGVLMAASQGDVAVDAQPRRVAGGYELAISGKGRALPDGAVVSLRFRKIVNRADWSTRAIETRPLERAWGRCAWVERGAFQHRELLTVAGDVEVEFSIRPTSGEEGSETPLRAWAKIFR